MLSINTNNFHWNAVQQQKSIAINHVIRWSSEQLIDCPCDEIEEIVHSAVAALRTIEFAEKAGWFFLSRSGDLVDVFSSRTKRSPLASIFKNGLRELPWCLAELNEGKAIVVRDRKDLSPFAKTDRQFLSNSFVRSIAFLPSRSFASGRGVLILLSMSDPTDWSDEIDDECALLQNIFLSAYSRLLAQNDLRHSAISFHELFAASSIGMAILKKDGSFLSANNALCEILGYSENELRKMLYEHLVASFNQSNCRDFLRFLSDRQAATYQMKQMLVRKDQTLISSRIKVRSLKRSPAEDFQTLVVIEDLVEQRRVDHRLNKKQMEVRTLASQLIQSQENERKRLARELHDDIGQRLSLVASEVALLASQDSGTTPIFGNRLNAVRDDLDSLCSDIHSMSHDLHSYKLQHLGLTFALKDLCRRLSQPNFHIDLYVDNFSEPHSEEISLCLYRVAQEALNNTLKHAHASTAAVTLTKVQSMFYMTIQDSGIGFEKNACPKGLGLISMSERLKLVNGQLKLHSIPGRGTEIWVAIPDIRDVIEHRVEYHASI